MKLFGLNLKNFNLGQKLILLLLTIFLGGIIISSAVLYKIAFDNAKNQLNTQANMLISIIDSVRAYNNDQITPLLGEKSESEQKLLLQSIPSYAVGQVFKKFTNVYKNDYGAYLYKDAMINPTNLSDKADSNEVKIIETLNQQDLRSQGQLAVNNNIDQGYITIQDKKYFYTARPIKITDSSCLQCHSTLKKAPQSLQILYKNGTYVGNNGLNWEYKKVIGGKIVFVPAAEVLKLAFKNFILILGIFVGIFALAIFLVNLWLKKSVVRPINRMTQVAEAVSLGDMEADFEKKSNDEVGRLADAFTRLKTSLTLAMGRLKQKRNRNLDDSQ